MSRQVTPQSAPGTLYYCTNSDRASAGLRHTRGHGQPRRRKCQYCAGALTVARGWWGAFEHSAGTGLYPPKNAHRIFASHARAERWANPRELVVRWIPAEAGVI